MSSDAITVCIPAFQAEPFVRETLLSIQAQSHERLRVLISVDRGDDQTESICRAFAEDARFTVVSQPTRLGWSGNVNFLFDRVETEFFSILLHDDLLEPTYLERLLAVLTSSGTALAAYSDIQLFGAMSGRLSMPTLSGTRIERAATCLTTAALSVPFRGVIRTSTLRQGLRLRDYGFDGFFADQLWVFELACLGPCLRLAEPLYRKRMRPASLARNWEAWPPERKIAAWSAHTAELMRRIRALDLDPVETAELTYLALQRPLRPARWRIPDPQIAAGDIQRTVPGREAFIAGTFCNLLDGGSLSEADVAALCASPRYDPPDADAPPPAVQAQAGPGVAAAPLPPGRPKPSHDGAQRQRRTGWWKLLP
jgi:hypothetical protein